MVPRSLISRPQRQIRFLSEEAKWAYLAAAIDGEGCVGMSRTKDRRRRDAYFVPYIIISNTNEDWIKELKSMYGGGYHSINKNNGWGNKPICAWKMRANPMRETIPKIKPYIFIKKRQLSLIERALVILEQRKKRSGNKWEKLPYPYELERIWIECKKLNARGGESKD